MKCIAAIKDKKFNKISKQIPVDAMAVQVEACVGCVNGKAAWSLFSKKAIDPSFKDELLSF